MLKEARYYLVDRRASDRHSQTDERLVLFERKSRKAKISHSLRSRRCTPNCLHHLNRFRVRGKPPKRSSIMTRKAASSRHRLRKLALGDPFRKKTKIHFEAVSKLRNLQNDFSKARSNLNQRFNFGFETEITLSIKSQHLAGKWLLHRR